MMIKALLLDLDGTLLDESKAFLAGSQAFFEVHRERLMDETFDNFRLRWEEIMNRHWSRYMAGELDFVGQQRERAREALGMRLTDDESDAVFASHRVAYQQAAFCFDDVAEFMPRTKGLAKIAVTNAHLAQQRIKMERAGLLADIPDLVTPEDVGVWKPDVRIFEHALRVLRVNPEEVMMIGDDYECDIAPAEKLGMKTFWVRRPEEGLASVEL